MIGSLINSIRSIGAGVFDFLMEIGYPFTLTLAELRDGNGVFSYVNPVSGLGNEVVLRQLQVTISWLFENVFFIPDGTLFFVACLEIVAYSFFVVLAVKLVAWFLTSFSS